MLKLYNTLTHKKEAFKPLKKLHVGIYSCGPTVYNYAHIGNLRSFIFADILRRTLEYNGYKVKQVMNITDVGHLTSDADSGEDKMERGARREKKTVWDIAKFYTEAFKKDIKALNILPATLYPKATDHIKEQINLVRKLEKKGFTYETSDGIYFDTSRLKDYGKLARLDIRGLKSGARVENVKEKKNITDFALWKFSPSGERRQMEWDSPWGVGFPGWHIECSAMSEKYLGQTFDIHTGGIDHIPVHHTNEMAQSEAANEKPLAQVWMHGEFLVLGEKEKMSKSGSNFITLEKVIKKGFNPLAYRYFTLGTHYRHKLNFSFEALESAQKTLNNLYDIVLSYPQAEGVSPKYEKKFRELINNDLDMPGVLALIWTLVKDKKLSRGVKKSLLLKFDEVLGLGLAEIKKKKLTVPAEIKKLLKARDEARNNKNWPEADRLREEIEENGFVVEDMGGESVVKYK